MSDQRLDVREGGAVLSTEAMSSTGAVERIRPEVDSRSKELAGSPFPAWLRVVDAVHGKPRSLSALVVNALVLVVLAGAVFDPLLVGLLGPLFLVGLFLRRKYATPSCIESQGVLWQMRRVSTPAVLSGLVGVLLSTPLGWNPVEPILLAGAMMAGVVGVRVVTWVVLFVCRRFGSGLRRTLVVGSGKTAERVLAKLRAYPEAGLLPVAALTLDPEVGSAAGGEGSTALTRTVEDAGIEHVVLAPDGDDDHILQCVHASGSLDAHFSLLPPLHDVFLTPGLVTQVGGLPLVALGKLAQDRVTLPGKRLFDLVVGGVLLVLVSPIIAVTAFAVWLEDRGPIFYRQRRVGRNGESFEMLKLRSMVVGADKKIFQLRQLNVTDGLLFKAADDPRVTRVGRIIRRLSLDELPQLLNVVRGDMSLVGPRPLAVEPEDFGVVDGKRHDVTPGITGYWQIAGGNGLTYDEMVKLDLAYIREWSLWLDCYLLLRTIPALVHRQAPA